MLPLLRSRLISIHNQVMRLALPEGGDTGRLVDVAGAAVVLRPPACVAHRVAGDVLHRAVAAGHPRHVLT